MREILLVLTAAGAGSAIALGSHVVAGYTLSPTGAILSALVAAFGVVTLLTMKN